ncbi:MAG: hypothetical protein PHN72_00335 [Bacilli bacterium]|nr:hypothetical protein [Bacilli bacterium]
MEIFDGLEVIITAIDTFLIEPAFDKKKSLAKRLPYLILYILIEIALVIGGLFLSILFVKDDNLFVGILLLLVSLLIFFVFSYSLLGRKGNKKE